LSKCLYFSSSMSDDGKLAHPGARISSHPFLFAYVAASTIEENIWENRYNIQTSNTVIKTWPAQEKTELEKFIFWDNRLRWCAHAALAVPKKKQNKRRRELRRDVARCCGRVSYEFQHGVRKRVVTTSCEVKIRARDELRDEKRTRERRMGARTRLEAKTGTLDIGLRPNEHNRNQEKNKKKRRRGCGARERAKTRGNELCCLGSTVQDSCYVIVKCRRII